MSADDPALRLDALLAQHAWVRALARTLVRDEADADDLAQEAWLAALRSPPTGRGSVRGWFAAVLRNAARQRHRGSSRRERREDEVARPERQPSAHDVVARAEEQGRVVKAVLALDEPFRTAVLLRFLDDLPPREIAARTGVPVETARSRVQRGLARLRELLDEEHGGDGRTWRAALVPLAALPAPLLVPPAASGGGAASSGAASGATSGTTSGVMPTLLPGAVAMTKAMTVTVGVLALAAGGAIGWLSGAGDREELARLRGDAEKARGEASAAEARAQKSAADLHERDGEIANLRRKLAEETQRATASTERAAKAEDSLTAATAELAKLRPAAPESGPKGPQIAFAELSDAFGKVDWDAVGEHMAAMPPLLEEMAVAFRDGKQLPARAIGEIQRHNGPLVTIAVTLARTGKVSGTGANGAFTHPAFAVNALAAALEQIGKPLSQAQLASFADLGRRFTAEEAQRVAAYDDTTFQLRKLVEEGDLKSRFFAAVREVLTPAQLDAVSPPLTRDRVKGDLWSAGIFWLQFVQPMPFEDRQKLVDEPSRILGEALKLSDDGKTKLKAIVTDWVAHLPEPLVHREVDGLEKIGSMPTPVAQMGAVQMQKLVERVATELALEGDSLTAARKLGFVIVPLPGKAYEGEEE